MRVRGGLNNKIFRIANMGDIQDEDRVRLIAALKNIFGDR
jgi:aspartate aminotransferase-like enzyme